MPSDKQIAASRANGAKSRGPVTAAGKRNSSRNSLHHGMLARTVVLEGESRARFNDLLTSLQDDLQPETAIENLLVHKMAVAHWRQMRAWGFEKASISHDQTTDITQDALAVRESSANLNDYEMRFDRQFARALESFERFRSSRRRTNPATD